MKLEEFDYHLPQELAEMMEEVRLGKRRLPGQDEKTENEE